MKKSIALLLTLVMVATITAGCRSNQTANGADTTNNTTNTTAPADTSGTTQPTQTENLSGSPESALALLENVWALYGEEERFFAAGGDENNAVNDAPGSYDTANADALMFSLLVPEGQIAGVREAANLMHAMNSNILSAAAFRLAEGTDAAAFADAMRDAVQNNQWLCGFPEKLLIATVDKEYVVVAYGQEPLTTFQNKLTAAYPQTQTVYNEAIG